jgi:hypothetical protein
LSWNFYLLAHVVAACWPSAGNNRAAFAAMTKPSLRDTLIFIVIFSILVAAMFALVLFGMR